jgi:hypothetical protein
MSRFYSRIIVLFGQLLFLLTSWRTGYSQDLGDASSSRRLGPREFVPEDRLSALTRFKLAPLSPGDERELIERSLMVTHPAVVDNPRASGPGPWSFGTLMTEIANQPVTGIEPRKLVEGWLDEVKGAFKTTTLATWDQLSGSKRTMDTLPFRLLAIINRIDLRRNLVLGGTGAGELRFIYGLHSADGTPANVTVIFEFAVKRTTFNEIRAWGRQWYQLRLIDITKPDYCVALQQITDQYTLRGADSDSPPNRSALAQLRVSIDEGRNWRFAEFKVDERNTGRLIQVTAKQTPELSLNGTETINRFLAAYQTEILGNRHDTPVLFEGQEFLATNSNLSSGRPPDFFWNGVKLPADLLEVRHLFSLNTCSGCHARETDTDFFHVGNRKKGVPAPLSKFLTGNEVADPAGQKGEGTPATEKVRRFDDLKLRALDLQRLVEIGPNYELTRQPLNAVH